MSSGSRFREDLDSYHAVLVYPELEEEEIERIATVLKKITAMLRKLDPF